MNYLKLLLGVAIIALFSCQDTNVTPNPSDDIEFSSPPFDLEGIEANFAEDIAYDEYDDTKFDIFLPLSSEPTGLMIFIHGGGFTGGDKSAFYDKSDDIKAYLSNGIAVASINYRLLQNGETEGVLKSLNDSKRALQYIRSKAEDFNIDKKQVVLAGGSAGAGTALWLATNDDMADPNNSDPVLQESTRVKGIAISQIQCSYDIENVWMNDVFIDYNLSWNTFLNAMEATLLRFYGVSTIEEYNTPEIEAYRQQVDMLALMSADDPEIFADNTGTDVTAPTTTSIAYHHAFHVRELKERADAVGIPNVCYYGKNPILYSDPSDETLVDFVIRKINE